MIAPLVWTAVAALILGVCYKLLVQPGLRLHFGEERPSDHDARSRRRAFENNLRRGLVFAAAPFVAAPLIDIPRIPLFAIGAVFVGGGIVFLWTAIQQWRNPYRSE